jgi:hypothetical protein
MLNKIITYILKPVLNHAARRVILGRRKSTCSDEGRYSSRDVRRFQKLVWHNFRELLPDIPQEPTFSARVLLLSSCASLAMYRALVEQGLQQEQAISIIEDTIWQMIRGSVTVSGFAAKMLIRDPQRRLKISIRAANRYIFSRPAFSREDLPGESSVDFDYVRCPIADYFKGYDLGEICFGAYCAQDYAIASQWSSHLERSGTLAGGSERCDFRWALRV